jgi:peptide deformylase
MSIHSNQSLEINNNLNSTQQLLNLIVEPNEILHQQSKEVINVDDDIKMLMHNMLYTMEYYEGIGLAAIQIGEPLKVIVTKVNAEPLYFINANIINTSVQKTIFCEGCLSIPGINADVERYNEITVAYLDYDGNKKIQSFSGLQSICLQHEIDHTNGITFIQRLSKLKQQFLQKKIFKRRKYE